MNTLNTNSNNEKKIFGWGRYELSLLILFAFVWGFIFLDRLVMSFLAPLVMEDLGITDPQFGLINTFTTGCYAIAAIVLSPILESTGKRKKWLDPALSGRGSIRLPQRSYAKRLAASCYKSGGRLL